ncbi:D-alanyl-D-alanine carboxypeptidase family protein [Parachlamydia sp. AcF125]|uniref:D-alanyl-D-alanine carboxypeptidase family protein n=1 Tax=Parachlamydia sp. AcF125 TaxID=2795736 RepID=UPI001BCA0D7C|nr:D-alanyl-D-alanine carboxypeptidase family protein [Parachlamydia sp. AcF125]MBS4167390.1 D-alanyl-D-alanine carboxypeptidase DacB [Parachlamydia sp. AcF125]
MFTQIYFFISLLFVLFSPLNLFSETLDVAVEAEAAILMNAESGKILYEKNIYASYFPASITKIATAAYVLKFFSDKLDVLISADQDSIGWVTEEAKRKSNYTLPAYWLVPGGTHMGIIKDEQLSLEDLLYGLILVSANDSANVIAQYIGGTVPAFVSHLNAYTKQIGCKHTTFQNPHGLHHPEHKTTAYDMALIAKEALGIPAFCKMFGTVKHTRSQTNKQEPSVLVQNHPLLKQGKFYYAKTLGAKTGYTTLAGHNLVAVAKDKERTLIAVLLKTKERDQLFKDAIKLFETAFQQPKVERLLLKQGVQKFSQNLPWASKPLKAYLEEDVKITYYAAEEPELQCSLEWLNLPPPIQKGQVIGQVYLTDKEGSLKKYVSLKAGEDLSISWAFWMKQYFEKSSFLIKGMKVFGIICILIFLGGLGFQLRRR